MFVFVCFNFFFGQKLSTIIDNFFLVRLKLSKIMENYFIFQNNPQKTPTISLLSLHLIYLRARARL